MTGSVMEACTSATMPASVAIDVIIQAAPTDWINPPRLEIELAIQMDRNTGKRIGASADG
jgi:hypothetical protein